MMRYSTKTYSHKQTTHPKYNQRSILDVNQMNTATKQFMISMRTQHQQIEEAAAQVYQASGDTLLEIGNVTKIASSANSIILEQVEAAGVNLIDNLKAPKIDTHRHPFRCPQVDKQVSSTLI
ncbi:MAG: hypothetical protein EZS28_031006 [Streblomastix strix]|uniref:Uncharacterized protein n=1 Tax=Streblomastix strix TaxID=222440 RepID=A0A5J4USS7_9EUKA|nr:MAG: hypothetical protein EZS28_031006 [Streblomastix strix]